MFLPLGPAGSGEVLSSYHASVCLSVCPRGRGRGSCWETPKPSKMALRCKLEKCGKWWGGDDKWPPSLWDPLVARLAQKWPKKWKFSKKNQIIFFIFFFESSHSESKRTKKKIFFYHWVGHSRLRIFSEFSKFSKFSNFSNFLDIRHRVSLDHTNNVTMDIFDLKGYFGHFGPFFGGGGRFGGVSLSHTHTLFSFFRLLFCFLSLFFLLFHFS